MDDSLLFNILAAAPGYQPRIVRSDPIAGPTDVSLILLNPDLPDDQKMTGRVVDEKGEPVLGATVWITGSHEERGKIFGTIKDVDKVAFTDEDGRFLLTGTRPFKGWKLAVNARGHAKMETDEWLPIGDRNHVLKIEVGATISGHVQRDGKPVAGYVVGICHGQGFDIVKNGVRGSQIQGTNERKIATDEHGRFEFANVMTGCEWLIYPDSENEPAGGFFRAESFDSPASELSIELGDFALQPAASIRGRIVRNNGEPIPGDLLFSSSTEFGRFHRFAEIEPDGSFVFRDMPRDQFRLDFSRKDRGEPAVRLVAGKQPLQPGSLVGMSSLKLFLKEDMEGLKLLMEVEGDKGQIQ